MTIITKLALAIVLGAGCFGAGYLAHDPEPQLLVQTEIQYKDRVKVVTKTVKVTETKPDGTKIETVTTDSKSDSKTTTTDKTATTPARKDYSAGVVWRPDWRDPTWQPAGVTAGYRVVADLWIDATVTFDAQPSVLLGVRYEF